MFSSQFNLTGLFQQFCQAANEIINRVTQSNNQVQITLRIVANRMVSVLCNGKYCKSQDHGYIYTRGLIIRWINLLTSRLKHNFSQQHNADTDNYPIMLCKSGFY
ncbi:hypothetical protein K6025_05280 [Ehrlichia sp. JZT12]